MQCAYIETSVRLEKWYTFSKYSQKRIIVTKNAHISGSFILLIRILFSLSLSLFIRVDDSGIGTIFFFVHPLVALDR